MESLQQDFHRGSLRNPLPESQSALIVLDGVGGWAMCFNTSPASLGTAPEIPGNVLPSLDSIPGDNAAVAENNGLTALNGFGGWAMCFNERPEPFDVAELPVNGTESVTMIEQTLAMEQWS